MASSLAVRKEELGVLSPVCSEHLWRRIESGLRKTKLRHGQTLFHPSDDRDRNGEPLFLISRGEIGLEIPSVSPEKDKVLVVRIGPPSIIGWDDERTVCTAQVRSGSATVISISRKMLRETLLVDPAIARVIVDLQGQRCRPYLDKVQLLMEESTERVLLLLQNLLEIVRQEKHLFSALDPSDKLRLRHIRIAEETGLSRETVSRILERGDPRISRIVSQLAPFVRIVAKGGKLPESESTERASAKEGELLSLAKEIVGGVFERHGLEKRGSSFQKEVDIVHSQLLNGVRPGMALTAPERRLLKA